MEEKDNLDLSKQEFFGLMMMYAANIDGEEHQDELDVISNSIGVAAFDRCSEVFKSMNDIELINYFRDHKGKYVKSAMDEKIFLSEIKTVISGDHRVDIMERILLSALKKILKE